MRFRVPRAVAFLFAIAACGRAPATPAAVHIDTLPGGIVRTLTDQPIDSGRWSFRTERDIQPAEGDSAELLAPTDVALADDGSLLVVDGRPAHVKVFDPQGRFVRRIGREGDGPGEFRVAYIAVRGDTVVVQDPRNARAVTLNWRTGAALGVVRTACCYWSPIGVDGEGRAVVRTIAQSRDSTPLQSQGFVRFRLDGSAAETLWVTERRPRSESKAWLVREGTLIRMAVPVPLQPSAVYAIDPRGGFVTGWTSEYVLRTTRNGRDTVALFGRSVPPVAVAPDEKREIAGKVIASMREFDRNGPSEATLRASFDVTMIPDARPAYDGFWVDGAGRLWVRISTGDTTTATLDLFDANGRWLDVVRMPASAWPASAWAPVGWTTDRAAVLLEGSDGRPVVRVYRILRG